jgi:Fis family transcriptional regulator
VRPEPGKLIRRCLNWEKRVTSASKKRSSKSSQKKSRTAQGAARSKPLSVLTGEALDGYFRRLNGHKPGDLYQLVLGQVEKPLFEAVLDYTKGNQSEAAEILGINRGTLRKKLRTYDLLN